MDKKNQLDVTFCILYFSSNSCSTCFGQPCAHHQAGTCQPDLTTFPQPRYIPTRGYNITQSSGPDDGHLVARNMLSNYWKRNKEYKKWHLVGFSYPHETVNHSSYFCCVKQFILKNSNCLWKNLCKIKEMVCLNKSRDFSFHASNWRLLACVMWRRVVWYKFACVSGKYAVHAFSTEEYVLFHLASVGIMFVQNVDQSLSAYMTSHPRKYVVYSKSTGHFLGIRYSAQGRKWCLH